MAYCYAKLSKFDLLCLRVGGPGLGNLLFPWARAKLLAEKYNYHFIVPTWAQLKIGPILRGEFDSRNYAALFKPITAEVSGANRIWILLARRRISELRADKAGMSDVVEVSGMGGMFNGLQGHSKYLRDSLIAMLAQNRMSELEASSGCTRAIAVHVRYGDFSKVKQGNKNTGSVNSRQPIEWYVDAVNSIRKELGANTEVNVFSDAQDEELAPLMALSMVKRISNNNAIEDILLIGRHRLLVASGSTFSMWSSFLGQLPTIWFPGQKKFELLEDSQCEIEYEVGQTLNKFCAKVK